MTQMELMDSGVLAQLMSLEREAVGPPDSLQSDRLQMLKVQAANLKIRRDKLKHKGNMIKIFKDRISKNLPLDEDDGDSGSFSVLQQTLVTTWKMQLKDLQHAHHLIGGFDLLECKEGKSVCLSFHTAFEGVYLETYNMELDLMRTVQISRHNIPPSFGLESLAKLHLQSNLKAFLQAISQKLNALAGRKRQVALVKDLGSVLVMESNELCSLLVLMCKVSSEKLMAVLLTLEYGDLMQTVPTRVLIESEDKSLSESPQWKKNQLLLMESPVHTALYTMRRMGSIV
ncbi:hypothetical protein DNTS_016228 [Danionella cerebrum]|uniref:Centromere protein O n=1 Tax=Danionella cerebrum TaxID=2873325 RepID=A0A553Q0N5_9TELE|nr:hypothetical protein DNTS_016228 [Danionella translucida]